MSRIIRTAPLLLAAALALGAAAGCGAREGGTAGAAAGSFGEAAPSPSSPSAATAPPPQAPSARRDASPLPQAPAAATASPPAPSARQDASPPAAAAAVSAAPQEPPPPPASPAAAASAVQPSPAAAAPASSSPTAPPSPAAKQDGGPEEIKWAEFFDDDKQNTPSERFWDMNGQTVSIKGYMGEVLSFEKHWFLVIPSPGAECPFDNGDETFWNKIMIAFTEKGEKLRYTSGPLRITGRLDVGIKVDESGYKTMFRLYEARLEKLKE